MVIRTQRSGQLRSGALAFRFLLILLVLFAFLAIQTAAAQDYHDQSHHCSAHDTCSLCQAGFLTAGSVATAVELAEPVAVEWQPVSQELHQAQSNQTVHHAPRAPPI